jgi:hypothetical protein
MSIDSGGAMKRFIEGDDRRQITLLPESLEDYVSEENPIRAVEALVEALDQHLQSRLPESAFS